ncbi:DNA polymerase III subunit alpha [Candidatus Saccharibacteria bacterium]|nr:DNA polymerase III subunit alpha [Candidatus Saccharibacteria bacterium]
MGAQKKRLKPSDFVHLHTHTQYSLLDGLTKVPELINYVKELGMEAVAITDHGLMSGAIEFYKEARGAGLKPLIGMEAYVAPRKYSDKDPVKDRQNYHLTLLSMNNKGYQNLMRLSSLASLEGFYYRPRIDHDFLEEYNEGLIVLSGCMGGEVSDALRQGQYEQAKKIAMWYQKIFGDRYYIELMDHGHANHPTAWDEQKDVNKELLRLAGELKIPAVVTCDAHYLKAADQEAHEILLCVQTSSFLSEEGRFSLKDFELQVMDPRNVIKRWGESNPELIANTKAIADRCQLDIELGGILLPKFPLQRGETEKSLLEKMVWQGLAWRYGGVNYEKSKTLSVAASKKKLSHEIKQRADFELGVVEKMGFSGYFLIAADFINWGKDKGIVFGPGRGSTAGSLLAYATRITDLDPLKYDLLFERFLNPDRISMPDMDIDIQDSRRDEVISYCVQKYGRDRVANIVTFGRMAARNSVRDVARVLQVPYAEADRLAKMIPPPIQGRHTPLASHIKNVPELQKENRINPQAARVFDLAVKLEGTIRSHGVHAAGVVIAPDDIVEYAPLEMAQNGAVATQYSMNPVEDLGLLKIDFLGLSNLTTIRNALRIVKKVHGLDIDIAKIALDDKKTYSLLQRGETTGVFQLESTGMRRYLKKLRPTVFEDIVAMVALYRPGPMQWIDDFIVRKHGLKKIAYPHAIMKSALEKTYGVMVYQEQVMQISKDLCGFSGGQADTLRKAIGKKNPEVLTKLKSDFIEGAIKTSKADRQAMEKFWNQLEDFAAYCFNKSHAACYGLIAYQTAYLKAHYPEAFMAALMTSDYDNIDRLAIEIAECKNMGIEVLPPDINQSFHEFAVVPSAHQIRFGLDAIKNVGYGAAEEIIVGRDKAGGKFTSLDEFCKHVSVAAVNRKVLESLIKAGAFDSFFERSLLLNNVDNILALANRLQKDAASGQVDLFSLSQVSEVSSPSLRLEKSDVVFSRSEQQRWERELLGLYLSAHPLEPYANFLSEKTLEIVSLKPEMDGSPVAIGGIVSDVRQITTKSGVQMAFVKVADASGEVEIVVFPKLYAQTGSLLNRDGVIIVQGKLSSRDRRSGASLEELKVIAEDLKPVSLKEASVYKSNGQKQSFLGSSKLPQSNNQLPRPLRDATAQVAKRLYIRIESSDNQSLLIRLKEKLDIHRGDTEVVVVTGEAAVKQAIKLPQTVAVNESSLRDLAAVFGSTNVVVR